MFNNTPSYPAMKAFMQIEFMQYPNTNSKTSKKYRYFDSNKIKFKKSSVIRSFYFTMNDNYK